MVRITVSSFYSEDVTLVILEGWRQDWEDQLINLSQWENTGSGMTCTTDSTLTNTKKVVEEDLKRWKAGSVKRDYSIVRE